MEPDGLYYDSKHTEAQTATTERTKPAVNPIHVLGLALGSWGSGCPGSEPCWNNGPPKFNCVLLSVFIFLGKPIRQNDKSLL